jgi:transcriptional regulator with XRE-family HTH domain/quercetin dioxygenase-like cupin family protein
MAEDSPDTLTRGPTGLGRRVAAYRIARGMKVTQLAREVGVSSSLISQIERQQSQPSVSTLFALAEALDVPVDAFFEEGHAASAAESAARDWTGRRAGKSVEGEAGRRSADSGTDAGEAGRRAGDSAAGAGDSARHWAGGRVGDSAGGRRSRSADDGGSGEGYVVRRGERSIIEIEGGIRWERLTPLPLDRMDFLEIVYEPRSESHPQLYRHPGIEMLLVLQGRLDIHIGFRRHELSAGDSMHFPSSLPHRYVNPTDEETRAVTMLLHDQYH